MRMFMFFIGRRQKYSRYISFYISILCAVILALALFSYDSHDSSLFFYNSIKQQKPHNFLGFFGAHLAALCFYLFGGAAYILIPFCVNLGISSLTKDRWFSEWDRYSALLVSIIYLSTLMAFYGVDYVSGVPGGLLGQVVARILMHKSLSFIVYSLFYCVALVCLLLITRGAGALFIAHIVCNYLGIRSWSKWAVLYAVKLCSRSLSKITICTKKNLDRSLWNLEEVQPVVEPILQQEMLDILKLLKAGSPETPVKLADSQESMLCDNRYTAYSALLAKYSNQLADTTQERDRR